MDTTGKSCHASLLTRIEELKLLKAEQEATISAQFKDLKNSLNIGSILKESFTNLTSDKDSQTDIVKMAATTGANYIIEKVIGSNSSIKRYLGSILAEKVSNTFIGKMLSKI